MVGNGNGVVGGGGGGGDIAGYATQAWVNENYLSIEFFSKLFKAYDSAATPNEIKPNDTQSTITNIKAMFGFWTQQYISALGQNSGGGGGGTDLNEPLASINVAELGVPTAAGQVLTWNGTQWVYNIPGGGGGGGTGTVTSITAGTGLSGGTISTMGTIAINSTYQGYIQHGETAYGWGDHRQAGYATQTWVGQQGFALESNVYSKDDADAKFMTIAAFENLFNAIASDGSTKVNHPYAANVASIKAMFGLWTNQYLSALGLNSSGGGGGATSLVDLLDVSISNPSNGQALVYNSTTQKWENMNVSGGGGTVTQVSTGTGLTGGPITTTGTIAISSTYQDYIAHGEMAYGWGDHSQAGYATPSSVANQMQNYAYISSGVIHIGNNSITPLTQHQTVDGTFWGQSWTNGGTLRGDINAGSNGGQITGFHSIELNNYGTLSDYGGFIDFHFNGSSSDYTSRIIEDASGRLFLDASEGVRIGSALLSWDSTNNALKIQKIDGTAANFYATGGVSALGMSAGASSIDAMTFNYVTVNNQLKFGTNDDVTMYVDDMFYIDSNCDVSINGVEMFNNYVRANRLYLDSTRYLFISSGKLYFYDGSSNKEIAFTN